MKKAILLKIILVFNFLACKNINYNDNDSNSVQTKKTDNRLSQKNEITNKNEKSGKTVNSIKSIKDKTKSNIKKKETLDENKKQNMLTIVSNEQKNQKIDIKDKPVFPKVIPKLLLNQKSIKKEQIIYVDIVSNGTGYKKIEPGLSFICKCKNPKCKTNKDFVFINQGLGLGNLDIMLRIGHKELFCPVCNYTMKEENVLALSFFNCYYSSLNMQRIDPNKLPIKSNTKITRLKERKTEDNKISILPFEVFGHCCRYVSTRGISKK